MNSRHKSKCLLITAGALALAFALIAGCGEKEPNYQGIGLKQWVKKLDSQEAVERKDAANAIGAMGPLARSAELRLRPMAAADPVPAVRVAAIYALKAIGAPSGEFEKYLEEVTQSPLEGDEFQESMGESDELDHLEPEEPEDIPSSQATGEDDLDFLKEFEQSVTIPPERLAGADMPQDSEAREEWVKQRRQEAVATLLHEMQNPDVLAEMLNSSDPTQKRLAARMLQSREGGTSAELFDALTRAQTDSDTTLRRMAGEALKKWGKE